MAETLSVQVNVVNQVKLFRSNTFADPMAFVDELIQNAQRAGATELKIEVLDDRITFTDNGCGLDANGVKKLFTMNESGWQDENVKVQNPFGLGFFSVVAVADHVFVKSKDVEAKFDVARLMAENTTEVIEVSKIEAESEYLKGFQVTLTNLLPSVSTSEVMKRVRESARFIQGLKITLNGAELEQRALDQTDGSPFSLKVDNEFVTGWVRPWSPQDGYGVQMTLDLYYCGRHVRRLWEFDAYDGLAGQLHLKDGMLDLRAPDRKEIIRNEKWERFCEMIRELGKMVAEHVLSEGTEREQVRYEDLMDRYLTVEEAAPKTRFLVHDFRKVKEDKDFLRDLIRAQKSGETFKSLSEFLEQWEAKKMERVMPETLTIVKTPHVNLEMVSGKSGYSGYSEGRPPMTKEQINEEIVKGAEEIDGEALSILDKYKIRPFWVMVREAADYEKEIARAKHYKIPVILVRSKIEKKVLEHNGYLHISALNQNMKIEATLTNTAPQNAKEERIIWLLSVLSAAMGADHDLFVLGDLKVVKRLHLPEVGLDLSEEMNDVIAIRHEDQVLVSRNSIDREMINARNQKDLRGSDLAFLMRHLPMFAEEAALALNRPVLDLMKQAIRFLYGVPKHEAPKEEEAV